MSVVRQGLSGKKLETMYALLQQGKSVDEVSEWLEVNPGFVKKHKKHAIQAKKAEPEKNDFFENLTGEQLATGEGYVLKELREYLRKTYKVELASNSSRESTATEFLKAKAAAAAAEQVADNG